MIKIFLSFLFLIASFSASAARQVIKDGSWRFEMKATYGVIPFVIDFKYKGTKLTGVLRNGKENIRLPEIDVKKDLMKIPLQHYENGLELTIENQETLRGEFVRYNKNPQVRIPVSGTRGGKLRYSGTWQDPAADFTGEWSVTLEEEDGKKSQGIVILEQNGSKLNGTIMSSTGDFRYFEGYVNGELFEAASFDGVYNYVFKGRIEDKTKMEAMAMSNWKTKITGIKDPKASLPDPYNQTQIEKLDFSFQDVDGRKISLSDPKFKGKPVVVNFFGTWCPNCIDETKYLVPWYKQNQKRGVEIIALAFERSLGDAEARMQLTKVVKKMKIPYTMLLAGTTAEAKPMDKIPGLKNFISFPTTIFLNKNHEVVKVHAGFTGPSTGKYFEEWKKDFNKNVDELLR